MKSRQRIYLNKLMVVGFLFLALSVGPMGCTFPGGTKPVVKIGLIAPFEGEQRSNGYQRLYGVKLALQEANLQGGIAGYKVALVALNDYADPVESPLQAQELVIDSDIIGIIGQWDVSLFQISAPIYSRAQLAVVQPTAFTDFSDLPPTFAEDYEALGGAAPDLQAQQAYQATLHLFQAIEQAERHHGKPERSTVLTALQALAEDN